MSSVLGQCVLQIAEDSHFPVQNLPFGIFRHRTAKNSPRTGVAIGSSVLDMVSLADAGCFDSCEALADLRCFHQPSLNDFLAQGRPAWRQVRATLQELLTDATGMLADPLFQEQAVVSMEDVEMLLPVAVGDYTDFYASREHATNVGAMFRGADNALNANWLHLPVAYHGRSSSIVVSGTSVRRPMGQVSPSEPQQQPDFRPSAAADFELEMGYVVGRGNSLGEPISAADAEEHIFGMVLMNDWSARDIQRWEYQPLGPFNSKNWATSISQWVVPLDALEPFRCPAPQQDPPVLPYMQEADRHSYNVQLEVALRPKGSATNTTVTRTNLRHLYWTLPQMVAHHTAGGCNLRPGDLLGTGTLSHEAEDGRGCLLEITRGGASRVLLADGVTRGYLEDGDTVTLSGYCQGHGYRVGFGKCTGQLQPSRES